MAHRVGTQVGNYRLTHLLGQGGFAEVYLGEHLHLGIQAAIKLLHTPLEQVPQVEAFRQEARRIAQLSHPQIVRVLEFGFEGELPFLVLEYAPGGSLRQRHPVGTSLPPATVLTYVGQIAEALQYAHDQQIIHRDLKPQNLLVGRRGEVLLADFGISVVAASTSRQSSQEFAGTASYAAPEQIQGHPRPASDQYALAVVVYEWLCGQLPFTGSGMQVLWKQVQVAPPPLRDLVPNLPAAVEQVVLTALAKDPKERFGSVRAFATALAQASQPTLPASVTVPPPVPPTHPSPPRATSSQWSAPLPVPVTPVRSGGAPAPTVAPPLPPSTSPAPGGAVPFPAPLSGVPAAQVPVVPVPRLLNKQLLLVLLVLGILLYILGLVAIVVNHSNFTPVAAGLLFGGLLTGILAWIGTLVRQAKQKQHYWFLATLACALLTGPLALISGGVCALIYLLRNENPPPPTIFKQP